MLLELSYEWESRKDRRSLGGRGQEYRAREKKVREKEKGKQEQRGSWKDTRKMSGPQHLENRLGAIFRLP